MCAKLGKFATQLSIELFVSSDLTFESGAKNDWQKFLLFGVSKKHQVFVFTTQFSSVQTTGQLPIVCLFFYKEESICFVRTPLISGSHFESMTFVTRRDDFLRLSYKKELYFSGEKFH